MQNGVLEYTLYLITALVTVVVPLIYIRGVLRRRKRAHAEAERSTSLGLSEPITLHPVIDPDRCIGTEACIEACPEGEILGSVGGRVALLCPTKCIGHGACEAACPVGAITLVFGNEKRGIELPYVKPDFETNVPGVYIAGELGGMGLIRNAVTQGWEAVTYIQKSLGSGGNGSPGNGVYDVAIVGAGPAGFSATLKSMEMGLSYICFEQDDIGGAILTYPRRKLVMTQPMEIPLHGRVKTREMYKEELLDLWKTVLERNGLEVRTNEKVESVEGRAGDFLLKTNRGQYAARRILLAIGRRGTPRKLGVPGENSSKVAYRLIEPEQYAHSRVLVTGGGDSAVEAAVAVSREEGTEVTISYRGEVFSRIKERNRRILEECKADGQIRVLFRSHVREIRQQEIVLDVDGSSLSLPNNYVLILIGGTVPTEFLQKTGIELRTRFGEA